MLSQDKNTLEYQDVAVSTRIRLARNVREYPFENRMTSEQKYEMVGKVAGAVSYANFGEGSQLRVIDFDRLKDYERLALVEQHLISPEFTQNATGKGLLISEDQSVSIMVNEEDHIRIQILSPGMNLANCLEYANKVDDLLDSTLNYAFDDNLGFLTQCPTNLGTGLRASVMLHLPLLEGTGYLSRIASNLSKLGLTIRGMYGEGTSSRGSFYQVSNQVTLGISEEAAVKNLEAIVRQIILQERGLRKSAAGQNLEDKIFRAYGLLKYARVLSGTEFMDLSSLLRLGIYYEYIPGLSYQELDELILKMGAANLMASSGRELPEDERDTLRAKTIREKLDK